MNKNKFKMPRPLIFMINISLLLIVFGIYTGAADTTAASVIPNINAASVVNQTDIRIDSYDSTVLSGYSLLQNVQEINTASQIAPYPFKPFEGARCAAIKSSSVALSEWRAVTKKFDTPLNLSEYKNFFLALNLPELAASYRATISFCDNGKTEPSYTIYAYNLKCGTWNGIFADISGYSNRSNITSIVISVKFDTANSNLSEYVYYIDIMGAFKDANIIYSVKYLTSQYYAGGGTLSVTENNMNLIINDENPYIETYSFNSDTLSGTGINAIKIKFRNLSDCSAMTLYYTTERNPSFSTERSYILAVESGSDIQTCYFPIGTTPIEQLRILFNGATEGSVDIYSVTPASAFIPVSTGYGTVDECVISSNKREISVTGTLTETAYEEFKGMRLELYALGMNENTDLIYSQNIESLAQSRVDRSFSFKIPIGEAKEIDNFICSKFIVAAVVNDTRMLIDVPKFITNPETLAQNKRAFPKQTIKKGIITNLTEIQLAGAKNTYITVMLNRLLTLDDTAGYQYKHGGYTYYFSKDYVDILDTNLKSYFEAGITVSAIINLTTSADDNLNRILIHPDAELTRIKSNPAFNTESYDGVRYLRAAFSFLAERYSTDENTYGRIINYIIGSKAGTQFENYNIGEKTLYEFVNSYANSVRLAYNTIRSVNSSANIYISIDSGWDEDLPADNLLRYDNKAFIDSIAAHFKNHGDISWNLAVDPTPKNLSSGYMVWKDINAKDSFDSDTVTMRNIEMLCRYMSRQALCLTSNAAPRTVLLLEQGSIPLNLNESETELQASNYAYSFYKINTKACSIIESYIINYKNDSEFLKLIKYIDTEKSAESTEFAKNIIGITDWQEIITGFDISAVIKRSVSETETGLPLPESISGSASLWSFNSKEDTAGWKASEYCGPIKSGDTLAERNSLLRVQLSESPLFTEYRGISNTFDFATDLSYAPYISFDIQISMLPASITETEILVLLYSGDSYIEAKGTITEGDWNNITINASEFTGLTTLDRMKIWIRGIDGYTDIGEPLIFISDFTVHSTEYTSEEITDNLVTQRRNHLAATEKIIDMKIVWMLITVIIIASTLLIINILNRRSRKGETYDR